MLSLVQPCPCLIKLKQWKALFHFSIELISLIDILLTWEQSSLGRILEINISALGEQFQKQTSVRISYLAISYRESLQTLLVSHNSITFFV